LFYMRILYYMLFRVIFIETYTLFYNCMILLLFKNVYPIHFKKWSRRLVRRVVRHCYRLWITWRDGRKVWRHLTAFDENWSFFIVNIGYIYIFDKMFVIRLDSIIVFSNNFRALLVQSEFEKKFFRLLFTYL